LLLSTEHELKPLRSSGRPRLWSHWGFSFLVRPCWQPGSRRPLRGGSPCGVAVLRAHRRFDLARDADRRLCSPTLAWSEAC